MKCIWAKFEGRRLVWGGLLANFMVAFFMILGICMRFWDTIGSARACFGAILPAQGNGFFSRTRPLWGKLVWGSVVIIASKLLINFF
jgi:hypothetical protein